MLSCYHSAFSSVHVIPHCSRHRSGRIARQISIYWMIVRASQLITAAVNDVDQFIASRTSYFWLFLFHQGAILQLCLVPCKGYKEFSAELSSSIFKQHFTCLLNQWAIQSQPWNGQGFSKLFFVVLFCMLLFGLVLLMVLVLLSGSYLVIKELGDGTYGNVWKALNRQTNEIV